MFWLVAFQVHYPMEAFSKLPFSDTKAKLLEVQVIFGLALLCGVLI